MCIRDRFIICEKNNDRPVGSVYFRDIDHDNKKAEYGIFIGEADAAGRGIGSETARLAADYAREMCIRDSCRRRG